MSEKPTCVCSVYEPVKPPVFSLRVTPGVDLLMESAAVIAVVISRFVGFSYVEHQVPNRALLLSVTL